MSEDRTEQIRERLAAATRGPWRVRPIPANSSGCRDIQAAVSKGRTRKGFFEIGGTYGLSPDERDAANAALMANAPADLAYLLYENERLRNDIVGMQAIIDLHDSSAHCVAREADLAAVRAELEAIERALASDRSGLVPEKRGMPISELVQAALKYREDAVAEGWAYAGVVENDGHRDRRDWATENGRLRASLERHAPGVLAALDQESREARVALAREDGDGR